MKHNNFYIAFSRGLGMALLIAASVAGIAGVGAKFNQVPWLMIAGGLFILLIICASIWFLGYKSRQNVVDEDEEEEEKKEKKEETSGYVVHKMSPEEFGKNFNV